MPGTTRVMGATGIGKCCSARVKLGSRLPTQRVTANTDRHVYVPNYMAVLPALSRLLQILNMNVAGFVLIKDVDTARGTVTLVAPAAGQLPGRYLITGTLRSSID